MDRAKWIGRYKIKQLHLFTNLPRQLYGKANMCSINNFVCNYHFLCVRYFFDVCNIYLCVQYLLFFMCAIFFYCVQYLFFMCAIFIFVCVQYLLLFYVCNICFVCDIYFYAWTLSFLFNYAEITFVQHWMKNRFLVHSCKQLPIQYCIKN